MSDFTLQPNTVYSRSDLAMHIGVDDRTMRQHIRLQRRAGVPIVPVKGGGYKLAETDDEKRELLELYRGRALDELTTYSRLLKAMQVEGQMSVAELAEEAVAWDLHTETR